MSVQGLCKKAYYNKECAKWAVSQSYYDVAVSRYYYCAHQSAMHFLEENGIDSYREYQNYCKECEIAGTIKMGSHDYEIKLLIKRLETILGAERLPDNILELNKLQKLRSMRNKADYKPRMITETAFENNFYPEFIKVIRVICEILEKGECDNER